MWRRGWWRRAGTVLGSLAVLAGVLAVPAAASAAVTPGPTPGGVEDGTFSGSCLKASATNPATAVLEARSYRGAMGRVVRIVAPWDIATGPTSELLCFEQYVADAKNDGAVLDLSLGTTGQTPSLATYKAAVTKLASLRIASDISYLSAWNEPNNPAYLSVSSPALLGAEYFQAARQAFAAHRVTMVAGDFASGVSGSFFNTYADHLGRPWPTLWSIHPSTDVTNFEYYMWSGKTARRAGIDAAAISKVRQLAIFLHERGAGNRIWINEIYVEHQADRCPPTGVRVAGVDPATCPTLKNDPAYTKRMPAFSTVIQDDAARFINGDRAASLTRYLSGHGLPFITRYVYLRAYAASQDIQLPNATVLQVHFPTTPFYCTLSAACPA